MAAWGRRYYRSRVSDALPVRTLRSGRYAIVGELGAGSQAETLDAVDKRDGRAVAIKRFQVRGAKSWKDVELAEREARVLSTLCHPNLPVYIEHFEEDGALYLVMKKIEGETLAALRKRKALLSSDDVARFLADAELVLGYLHSRAPPIIHRDIKPGNVIRRADGSFAFVDFGSVRDQLKPEGGSTVVGTFGYMAPEQFQGRALPGSDVYAVAATALALVTGREPEELPHRGLAIDVRAALGAGAEPWLVRALSAMLDPDPDKRPGRVSARRPAASEASPRAASETRRERRQQTRDEARRMRRELRQQIHDEARRVRREARDFRGTRSEHWQRPSRGFGPLAPLLISVIVLGLVVARVATWALFRAFLPTLLVLLSVFFGRGLRRAAWRCRDIGVQADRGLLFAMDSVRGRVVGRTDIDVEGEPLEPDDSAWQAPRESAPRTRVDTSRTRVETHPTDFDEPETEPDEREQRKGPASG
jgi:tRNA A-37 threonylcarbamoyl transferase component Bud32